MTDRIDLSARLMARISRTAHQELAAMAREAGRKPSEWARAMLYKALKLTPAGEKVR
jgi:predicted HicB family RNase H-like nuclease